MKVRLPFITILSLTLGYFAFSQNPNETCANAETITLTTSSQTIDLNLDDALFSNQNGCSTEDMDNYTNYWYEFTLPTNSNLYINVTINNHAEIYDACNGTKLHCFSTNNLITDLVGGQTYKLRVFRSQSQGTTRNYFHINTYDKITNDDCSSPEILPALTENNTAVQFQLAGASSNLDTTCGSDTEEDIADAWFQFTMPVTGNLFVDAPYGIAIYDACGGTELFCNASESSTEAFKLIDNLTQGQTYLLRFFSTEQHIFEVPFQNLNVRAYERAANDECVNAETIPTITNTSQEVLFDTFGSLINFENSCVGLPQEDFVDVWFKFTMPDYPVLNFESFALNFFTIYDACNGNEIECFAGNEELEGLTVGQTYKLRVFQRQTEMFHQFKYFDIWASETLSISTEEMQKPALQLIGNKTLYINHLDTTGTIEIYNLMGQKVLSEVLDPSEKQYLEINEPTGIYFAKLFSKNRVNTLKMVIKN
ncbi:MAG TPA: T9SS type A sorting domain-containing protein [Mangrovimonas sp.]|nr:T9SS type A sorting domain-containing protein [Mangrovimonas sp.]